MGASSPAAQLSCPAKSAWRTRAASACSARACLIPWARRLAWPPAGCIRPGGRPAREARATDDASSSVVSLGERPRGDDLPPAEVAPRHTTADPGDDLVGDRPAGGGEILGGPFRAGLS